MEGLSDRTENKRERRLDAPKISTINTIMITLYIKTHRITGLKYFGKTTKADPVKYWGSGKYWRRHLMKHGYDCDTEIYLQSENVEYITQEALRFSRAYDIANSDLWANLKDENGIDGQLSGVPLSEETRKKMSEIRKGVLHTQEWRDKIAKSLRGVPHSKERVENSSRSRKKLFEEHPELKPKPPSAKGIKHTAETRERMSKAQKGKIISFETRKKISNTLKGIPTGPKTKEHIEKQAAARARNWLVVDPQGNEQLITNLSKFCKEHRLNDKIMSNIAHGKGNQHKGWKCEKKDERR